MSYAALTEGFRDIALVRESMAVLDWDGAVLMPEAAAERRGQQVAALEAVVYEKLETMAEGIDSVDDCPEDLWNQANLREMRRQITEILLIPKDMQRRVTEAKSSCEMAWRKARQSRDFGLVAAELTELVTLSREALLAKAEGLGMSALDAAVSAFEPDLTAKKAERLLEGHAEFIRGFLPEAQEKAARRKRDDPNNWSLGLSEQDRLCRGICARMGLPDGASRIDLSTHPFSSGYPNDARITVRYDEKEALSGLNAAIHETGHALYEIGLPQDWNTQPVGQSRGMALHESQSLTMEMQAGRSPEFLQWLAEHIRREYDPNLRLEALLAESWNVTPSPIRVEADEVTYPLHVLLRFRLERDLLAGTLAVRDLPEAFRAGLKELLGLDIIDDTEGCLQDIHWYAGLFGYFPSYALGAMAAAQLFAAARNDDPLIVADLTEANFQRVSRWMGLNVHALGCLYSTDEVLERATGAELDCTALQRHLQKRYG